jgi:diadenylate cyclase
VIAVIILFQPELRRMLSKLGRNRFLGAFFKDSVNIIDTLASSVEELSKQKTGALIAIETKIGLKNYIESGVMIDAILSGGLIHSIFKEESPLHDGAAIIRGGRIVAAKCILPLSERHEILKKYGTRHLAALGLSEESDAFVIVVSEETGKISIASNGKMEMGVSKNRLKERLDQLLTNKS